MRSNRIILIVFLIVILSESFYAQVDTSWVRRFSGSGNFNDRATAITADCLGNVYITGYMYKSASDCDYLTVKYSPNGDTLWTRKYNGSANNLDQANAITVDNSGNVYVTGYAYFSNNDYLTIKYNQNGDTVWTRQYNGSSNGNDAATAITVDVFENVYITGRSYGNANDILTIKYNSIGDSIWTRRYHGGQSSLSADEARTIAIDGSDNIIVAGYCSRATTGRDYCIIKYNQSGDTCWRRFYDGGINGTDEANALTLDASGNIYITGFCSRSGTSKDYVTIKYNSSGSLLWASPYINQGSADDDVANAIKLDYQNNIFVTGYSAISGYQDWATIKYNYLTGETLWVRRFDRSNSNDNAKALAIDAIGNVFVTGHSVSVSGYEDWTTKKYNTIGDTLWTRTYHGPISNQSDEANAIAVDKNGNIIIAGFSNGSGTGEDFLTIMYYTEDVAVTKIIQPCSCVDSAATITPKAQIKNFGNRTENFNVTLKIPTMTYTSTKPVPILAPFDSIIVDFDEWIVGPRSANTVKCSTELITDMVRYNDKLEGSFVVHVRDYAVTSVAGITEPVDSGATIFPSAVIHNFGSVPGINIPVVMYIPNTSYADTQFVSLDACASITQDFSSFATYIPRSTYTMRCTTRFNGDIVPNNNQNYTNFTMRVRDFGVSAISSPPSFVDSGATVTPKAWIHNYGTHNENNVTVNFYITGPNLSYTSTRYVTLNAGSSIEQNFDEFVASLPLSANYTMRCTTSLTGDQVLFNDLAIGAFTIRRTDVGVIEIIDPPSELDSTTVLAINPRAKVKNYGTQQETFNVTFCIGSDYSSTKQVSSLQPDNEDTIWFDPWVIGHRGTYRTECYTQLETDPLHSNDTVIGSVIIRISDVGVTEIMTPIGDIDSSGTINPQVKVKNFGTQNETFNVLFTIDDWSSIKEVTVLQPNDEDIVTFDSWPVESRGSYAARCSTYLASDVICSNDTISATFAVRVRDFAVTSIIAPSPVDSGTTTITPKAWVYNYGSTNETNVPVTFTIIGTIYNSTRYISLNSGDSIEQDFDNFSIDLPKGNYSLRCTTQLNGDIVSSNNLAIASITVVAPGWHALNNISLMGRGIKDGGAMTVINDTIYALQGANTQNFFAYKVMDDTWIMKCSIPYAPKPGGGIIKKKVKAGGALTVYNDIIYAFKGNGTREFWSYYPNLDSWIQKACIKEFATNAIKATKVKAGAALVACADSIYAFKGGNTHEFWVYDINQDTWYQRKSLIAMDGTRIKKLKSGAALTAKGCTLYAFVGGGTNFFYSYLIGQDTWIKLNDASFGYYYATYRKKIKDGASLVEIEGKIYALKGGNTSDFGCYDIITNSWSTIEGIPWPKRVKAGGALACAGNQLYAFIGGNSNQFWRYTFSASTSAQAKSCSNIRSEDKSNNSTADRFTFNVSPNPFTKVAIIHYNLPIASKVSIKLYNDNGRLIETFVDEYQKAGTHILNIENWKLGIPKGIYFLKYEDEFNQSKMKLILN